jgi:DNA-binding transcriptional MocR family regulator
VAAIPPSRLAELLGTWRRDGPAHQRLAATIRALVLDGRLPLQSQLPPERALASELAISRTTVTVAYNHLRAEGYVSSRQGSGSWTTIPGGHRAAPDALVPSGGIDMSIGSLPAPAVLDELFRDAVAELPRWLDHHGYDPLGLPPLRAAIAGRFSRRGLPTRPEQILVTNGALQALDLTLRAICRRGRSALVEIPGYPAALDAMRLAGTRVRAVPVTSQGWDLDALDALARAHSPELAYLIPDFQNPTGALIDAAARRRALRTMDRAGSHTVIDETFVELRLDDIAVPPPAAATHASERTITIGSLSKAVWGGLRIGWARADPAIIRRLATLRATIDLAGPVLEQIVATKVLGCLDELMDERRALIRRRRAALIDALGRHLPDWRYVTPAGGLFIWAELPEPASTSLSVQAREHGLFVTPGPRFGAAGLLERYVRLPFTLPPAQLEQAAATLAGLARLSPARVYPPAGHAEYVA